MHEAVRFGQLEAARLLLADGRFDARAAFGWTPLHVAAQLGNAELVELLLLDGRFNAMRDQDGWTALHVAADIGQVPAVRMLLQHDSFNSLNNNGETPLHLAARLGHLEIMRVLLADGRFNLVAARNRDTILHSAVRSQNPQVVWILIYHFLRPDLIFGADYRYIGSRPGVSAENREALLAWPRPVWRPANLVLYPLYLRRALLEWLRVGSWNQGLRDAVAMRIVNDYYRNPYVWNPYNEENARARFERHQQELERVRQDERRQLHETLLTLLWNAAPELAADFAKLPEKSG